MDSAPSIKSYTKSSRNAARLMNLMGRTYPGFLLERMPAQEPQQKEWVRRKNLNEENSLFVRKILNRV